MRSKKEWETKSLEWIHKVREEIDEELKRKGMTPTQWVKARGKIDIKELCKKMDLKNITIIHGYGSETQPGVFSGSSVNSNGAYVNPDDKAICAVYLRQISGRNKREKKGCS